MTIDKKTLNELKEALLKEKGELEGQLERIAKPTDKQRGDYETSFEEIGSDKDDNATEVDQYSQNLSVETSLEKRLQNIINAIAKTENGDYGKCENCQKDIPLERLKANPSSRTCFNCQG